MDVPVEVIDDPDTPGCADLFVTVDVGGTPVRCVLDSGSPRTHLLTAPPGARHVGRRRSSGLVTSAEVDEYEVHDVRLGDLVALTLRVDVAGGVPHPLVGLDLIGHGSWTLDVGGRTLSLGRRERSRPARPLQRGPRGHIVMTARWDGLGARALWDTGAGVTLVDHRFVEAHPSLFRSAGTTTATDLFGGQVTTALARIAPYEIEGVAFDSHVVAIADLSVTGEPFDLGLGYPTIRQARWTMDFAHDEWLID